MSIPVGWCTRAMLGAVVVLAGCASEFRVLTCDPVRCMPPPGCFQRRGNSADHVCLNYFDRNRAGACSQFNGVASGFGQPGEWNILGLDVECSGLFDEDQVCDRPCTDISFFGLSQPAVTVTRDEIEPCPDPVTTCHVPAPCMWMTGGCFGPDGGGGSLMIDSVISCDQNGRGRQCLVNGVGNELGCAGTWSFDRAFVNDDCTGAQLSRYPCPGAMRTSFRVVGDGLVLTREGQPDVMLRRGGGSCSTVMPPPRCTPTALQGCWVSVDNPSRYVRLDAATPSGPDRWIISGETRATVCGGLQSFTGAEVDTDCMGLRAELPCLPADDHPAVFRLATPDRATIMRASGARLEDLQRSVTGCDR